MTFASSYEARAIEAVLNEILGLHNKHKAAVHSVHRLTGPKKKKKKKKKKMLGLAPIFQHCVSGLIAVPSLLEALNL